MSVQRLERFGDRIFNFWMDGKSQDQIHVLSVIINHIYSIQMKINNSLQTKRVRTTNYFLK